MHATSHIRMRSAHRHTYVHESTGRRRTLHRPSPSRQTQLRAALAEQAVAR